MPVLKAKHVVSCSSEDEKHPADNMLKPETYYKWRCATPGETSATIVLQLEKSCQITGIDIGNNGSAFVEVLVGRSSWSGGEDFQVLLAASTFMTPVDSKAGKEVSRVRMFGADNLNNVVSAEKWDQLKIVCRQPYNTSETYGLSFIKLYTSTSDEKKTTEQKSVNLGRFKLKSDSDEESGSTLSTGSFFQKRMNIPVERVATPKMSMAASARSSEPSPRTLSVFKAKEEDSTSEHPKKISLSDDKRREVANALLQGSEDKPEKGSFSSHKNFIYGSGFMKPKDDGSESFKRKIEAEAEEKITPAPPTKKVKDKQEAACTSATAATPTPASAVGPSSEKAKIKKPKLKIKKTDFNQILSGVVFALSGYQNPERSNVRDLALSMGAKYEASWSNRCTHLVCAFANTPKFKEVKGKGKIVTKKWFQECDAKKRKVNTKPFRIDGGGESSFESSGSEDELNEENQENTVKKSSSECDTEDEIEKIRQLQREGEAEKSSLASLPKEDEDVYDLSTDDEKEPGNDITKEKDPLPKFFEDKKFFLYGDFDTKDSKLLKRHITAYAGSVSDYMRETVNIVISGEAWDTNFDHAYEENSALVFVQPKWIFKCHEKQMFVPYENYLIKRGDNL